MIRSRTLVVAVLLAVTLALTSLLAARVNYAIRSHRNAAEFALRDYSGFAAAEFERRVRRAFDDAFLRGVLRPGQTVNSAIKGIRLPPPRLLADTSTPMRGADIRKSGQLHAYFLLHLPDGALDIDGVATPAERQLITGRVRQEATALHDSGAYYGVLIDAPETPSTSFAYLIKSDAAYQATALYGVLFATSALKPVLEGTLTRSLLPRLAAGMPDDSALATRVLDAAGTEIFRSRPSFDTHYFTERPLGMQLGALRVQVAARGSAAGSLLSGGLPAPRASTVFGPVVLCAILLGVAVVLLRREFELARMQSDFVANVSHELRTPLAQIRMFSETLLLGRVRTESERLRSLEIMNQEATRLTNLVENLLHFSRGGPRVERMLLRDVELTPFVQDVVTAFTPLGTARHVKFHCDIEPGVAARADTDALRQMLLNLLDNTLKYGPVGQTVTIGAASENGEVRIHVDDQGPGVPMRERQRIFARFARASAHREANTGTGIGLAVVAELVGRHGGRVWVEDAPGGGARFVLTLPRVRDGAHLKTNT